ncbi:hypothetical protein CF319_g8017 [Tilletia indica]|nr:hypothetical protein CF319_g8017 [Tilletia indica]
MANWAALTECDDARDFEQLARRKRESVRNIADEASTSTMVGEGQSGDNAMADVDIEMLVRKKPKECIATMQYTKTLTDSGWFSGVKASQAFAATSSAPCPAFSRIRCRQWKQELKSKEIAAVSSASIPKATSGVLAQDFGLSNKAQKPTTATSAVFLRDRVVEPSTKHIPHNDVSPAALIEALSKERNLNNAQQLAFSIAAQHFFAQMSGTSIQPLRLLMHGAGGTGKTVVVRLLRELLERYGKGAQILFMAPTGKAASAIGGSTQHSAFALHVHRKNVTADELGAAHKDDITPQRIKYLQEKLRDIAWVFFDEVSMTSCETMAEIDQSLRVGKEVLDVPFGGVNVLFAGDLCQLPPVGATPLYRTYASTNLTMDNRTKAHLGRAVWKEVTKVVEFTEQMRMRDEDMAETLSRLRLRKCVAADARLLNANVLKSDKSPDGLSLQDRPEVMVLTRTNHTVRTLNHEKAAAHGLAKGAEVHQSYADDTTTTTMTNEQRIALLSYHGMTGSKIGLGRLPLFVGMPVVFRGGNQSVALGVTNGAFAVVAGYDLVADKGGLQVARGLLLRFPRLENLTLTGLPEGCYPIIPMSSKFSFKDDADGPVIQVARKQLPIQPGFAMTVHSAQGITAENGVVVDLTKGGFEALTAPGFLMNFRKNSIA